jgi:hypothetical protein
MVAYFVGRACRHILVKYTHTVSQFYVYAHFTSPVCIPSNYNDLNSQLQYTGYNVDFS